VSDSLKDANRVCINTLALATHGINALSHQLALELMPLENFRLELDAANTYRDISGVPDLSDVQRGAFRGLSLDLRYRLLDRKHALFGLANAG
jgi:hypothetical protein